MVSENQNQISLTSWHVGWMMCYSLISLHIIKLHLEF